MGNLSGLTGEIAMLCRRILLTWAILLIAPASGWAQSREEKVRRDRREIEAEGLWIYNDFTQAKAQARSSGKPILAVLRCIPCEECVKLDEEVIRQDPHIKKHLDRFVRVRLVSTNGLDLSIFQFDTDQSFAVFFLEADGTILGRFGTRSHRTDWRGDVSVEGLAEAMEQALKLHQDYPGNQAALSGKTGKKPEYGTPEKMPPLAGKFTATPDYQGNVVKSCIHCHQIGDAVREMALGKPGPLDDRILFPYPHPKTIGLTLDPKKSAEVTAVAEGSVAAKAGLRPGDSIRQMQGQPLISIADVQWVLQGADPAGAVIEGKLLRAGKEKTFSLELPKGWRHRDDFAWRASTWGLRRAALGGIFFKPGTGDNAGKLVVEHVGAFAPHDVAKRAGFQKGDILVEWDGKNDFTRETDLIAYMLQGREERMGPVEVTVLRSGTTKNLRLDPKR